MPERHRFDLQQQQVRLPRLRQDHEGQAQAPRRGPERAVPKRDAEEVGHCDGLLIINITGHLEHFQEVPGH